MKRTVVCLLLMFCACLHSAAAQENKVYLKDGKIVIEPPDAAESVQYDKAIPSTPQSKKWSLQQEINPVEEALKVYNKKSAPLYQAKVWITDKDNGNPRILIEYLTDEDEGEFYFSGNGSYLFYKGFTAAGQKGILGYNLLTQSPVSLLGLDHFSLVNCADGAQYIVVRHDEDKNHAVYSLNLDPVKTIPFNKTADSDIRYLICL